MLKLFPDITNYFGANSCFHSKSCSRTGWLVPLEGNKGRLEGPEIWAGVPAYGFHFHLQHLFNTLPLNKVIMISFNLQQVCLIFHDLPGFLVNSVLFSIPPWTSGGISPVVVLSVSDPGCSWVACFVVSGPGFSSAFRPVLSFWAFSALNARAARNSVLCSLLYVECLPCCGLVSLWTGHSYT